MLKKILLAIIICLLPVAGEARHYSESQIERYVEKTPRRAEDSVSSLAKYLAKPFDDDYDKAMAIAFWIAGRITYDAYLYNNGSATRLRKNYDGQTPDELLQSRVGICSDFTNLFIALCQDAGIRASYISGYVYPKGTTLTTKVKNNSSHAWNYFVYKGHRIYVDTTFMARGNTGTKGGNYELAHKRALKKIKRANAHQSTINEFDGYYFDFDYDDEKNDRGYIRKEIKF